MLASPVFLISFTDLSHGCGNSCLVNVAAFLFSVKSTVFTSMDKNKYLKKKNCYMTHEVLKYLRNFVFTIVCLLMIFW